MNVARQAQQFEVVKNEDGGERARQAVAVSQKQGWKIVRTRGSRRSATSACRFDDDLMMK